MADKDTINATPDPDAPDADTPDAAAQYYGSNEFNSPYSLITCKFPPYSANTTKKQKKKEKKMDDKVTIDTPLFPYAPSADTPNSSVQDSGSTDFNSPYSLRNHKFSPYSVATTKN